VITFSRLGRHGRLGNQLFQYAALRSLSLEKGYECRIPDPQQMHWHGQNCLLGNFNIEASYLEESDYNKIKFTYIENNLNKFDKNFFYLGDGVDLFGYFQSTKYFNKYKEQIIKELTPRDELLEEAKEFVESNRVDNCEIVSIHLRMGDLNDGTNPVYNNFYGNSITDKSTAYGSYLNKALEVFKGRNVKFLVFAGGSRSNAMENPSFMKDFDDRFVLCSSDRPLLDFSKILSCDHNICCHLTTFGWWAAYLNPNKEKIVTIPKDYFWNKSIQRDSFLPQDWRMF